ncbi:MAG: hypothetical protein K0R24_334 [Gammaproteobacteria bacterium]|jgi:conjugal transfer mating pair stabilization protein TraG|nr:hypothetical protein [Gammaproteobacteria bacterium]
MSNLSLPVIVYGNRDLFIEYFKAIVATIGTTDFKVLCHIAILLAGVSVLYGFILNRDLTAMLKWFALFYVSLYILFIPKATIVVTDRLNGDLPIPNPIKNVPLGLAMVASYTSVIGDTLTRTLESTFTMPEDLRYSKTGMVFASRLMEAAGQFEITDAKFDENMREFAHQCIFYDILLNKYSMDSLTSAPDLWIFISKYASPARAFIYDRKVVTCSDGATKLTQDWKDVIDKAIGQYGQLLFPHLSKEQAKTQILKFLPTSYFYLTKLSDTANNIMQQNLMANAIQRGIVSMGAKLDAAAAIESYAFTRAQEQKRLTMKTLGDMAAHWLPLMKNVFEAIMYGSFIFIVLLSVFPFGGFVVKNYLYTLLWIQLWAPLYAIINLTISYYGALQSTAIAKHGISLKVMSSLLQINSDISTLAGYLTLSVPFLSAGLVKGMASTFTQLAQYIGGVTQSSAAMGAGEAVSGNISFGNTNVGNHSAFNMSSNHIDTSGRFSSNMITTQLPGGSMASMMPDGSVVMNTHNSISHLGTSVNLAKAIRATASQQADAAFTHANNQNRTFSEAFNSAMRNVYDLSDTISKSDNSSESWSHSMNGSTANALSTIHNLTERFATSQGITFSDAERALTAAYMEGRVGGSIPLLKVGGSIGGKVEHDKTNSMEQRESYSEAREFVKTTNYSQSMDVVERASHDRSFRTSTEKGQRLVEGMSTSFDHAESARRDMLESYQKAQNYREIATHAKEDAVNVGANASQVFQEWLLNQPSTRGDGKMNLDEAENIVRHHPQLAANYAEQFSRHYVQQMMSRSDSQLSYSAQSVEASYQLQSQKMKGEKDVVSDYQSHNKAALSRIATQTNLSSNTPMDKSIKNDVDSFIAAHQKEATHVEPIDSAGQKIIKEVKHQEKKE